MPLVGRSLNVGSVRCYSHAAVIREKVVEVVPALGESITEGSISHWTKQVGEAVAVDDCIVVIETDKVTVDIKSTRAGVLTRQIGGDEVAVGDDIFEIDTEGVASVEGSVEAAPSAPVASAPAPAAPATSAATSSTSTSSHRTPSIKFIGKRSLVKAQPKAVGNAAKPFPSAKAVKEGNGVDFRTVEGGAWFGRPQMSDAEMEAIESGGASLF